MQDDEIILVSAVCELLTGESMLTSTKSLIKKNSFQNTDFLQPRFDKDKLILKTKDNPLWLHFGANDGCMLPALLLQNLIENKENDTGVIVAEAQHYSNFKTIFKPFNNNGICIKNDNSNLEAKIISSVAETLNADMDLYPLDWQRLVQIFRNPSIQVVSFSLGEASYTICGSNSKLYTSFEKDCNSGPQKVHTELGKITALCLERYRAGEYPLTLLSFDFCAKNGSRLNEALVRIAREWEERGLIKSGFSSWLNEPEIIAFPWTTINRKQRTAEEQLSIPENLSEVLSVTKTGNPPYVFFDDVSSLLIEDDFPNGRLPLEDAGVHFSSRDIISSLQ